MSDIKTYPVCFTGQLKSVECDASFQKDQAETFKHYIRFARQNKATTLINCQCMKDGEGENRRRLKACYSSTHDNYWLARWSYSGSEHASDCRFYSVWADEKQGEIYTSDVVKAVSPGHFRINYLPGYKKKRLRSAMRRSSQQIQEQKENANDSQLCVFLACFTSCGNRLKLITGIQILTNVTVTMHGQHGA